MEVYENTRADFQWNHIFGQYSTEHDLTMIGLYIYRQNKHSRIVTAVIDCHGKTILLSLLHFDGALPCRPNNVFFKHWSVLIYSITLNTQNNNIWKLHL